MSPRRPRVGLSKMMLDVNAEKKLTRQPPSASAVEAWVTAARELPRKVDY